MKKVYSAPVPEFQTYEMSQSIASNCAIVVDSGPAMGKHELCDGYVGVDPFGFRDSISIQNAPVYNVTFYEDTNCDCYVSSTDYGYWTS